MNKRVRFIRITERGRVFWRCEVFGAKPIVHGEGATMQRAVKELGTRVFVIDYLNDVELPIVRGARGTVELLYVGPRYTWADKPRDWGMAEPVDIGGAL